MTKIKLCGLSRACDIEAVNRLCPDYIGFVFAAGSRRLVSRKTAEALRCRLKPGIQAVGVFVNEDIVKVAELLQAGIIDLAQLHGSETEEYIRQLRRLTSRPIIKAFRIDGEGDVRAAAASSADLVLLDSGSGGTGTAFDWGLLKEVKRPYFLAGGLDADNAAAAIRTLRPYGVDVSSGIERLGYKDPEKMKAFVDAVRKEDEK